MRKQKLLFIAFIFGLLCLIQDIGMMVFPFPVETVYLPMFIVHFLILFITLIFNFFAWKNVNKYFAFVCAILYTVNMSFLFFFATPTFFLIPSFILCFISYSKIKKQIIKQNSDSHKKCPYCFNEIYKEATVCQYCGKDLIKEN